MKSFTTNTTKKIEQQAIDDLITDALGGGFTAQWCDGVRLSKKPKEDFEWNSEVITRGGELMLKAEGKWHKLTLQNVLDNLDGIDWDSYDAIDADAVIQKALFGEVIYG